MKTIQKNVDYRKLKIKGGNNVDYDFSDYKTFKELFRDLYYKETTIDEAERKQDEIDGVIGALKKYIPRNNKYVEAKNKLLNNVKKFHEGREKIIEGFKTEVFPLYYNEHHEEEEEQEKEEKEEETITNANKFNEWVNKQEIKISKKLFENHFYFQTPSALLKALYKTIDKE